MFAMKGKGDAEREDVPIHIPSLVPRANITMMGLQASVVKPFSVVTAAAEISLKK